MEQLSTLIMVFLSKKVAFLLADLAPVSLFYIVYTVPVNLICVYSSPCMHSPPLHQFWWGKNCFAVCLPQPLHLWDWWQLLEQDSKWLQMEHEGRKMAEAFRILLYTIKWVWFLQNNLTPHFSVNTQSCQPIFTGCGTALTGLIVPWLSLPPSKLGVDLSSNQSA